MAGANSQGCSLSDALAALPDLSDNIIKSDEHSCAGGAFSDVYKRQLHDDGTGGGLMEVAVKSLRFPFTLSEITDDNSESASSKVEKMMRRELGIWRRLKHKNIVPFLGIAYGFGRPGYASLVSFWMANGSLYSFLARHDYQLTTAHRLQLLLETANGLCYLHSYEPPVVHGDLSSHNVLLDRNYNARLIDFGFASMTGDMPEASLYLQMSQMKPGTIRFAAPEHFLADGEQAMPPTTQSDMYSFGNLGLLVLSGKRPWSEIQHEPAVIVRLLQGHRPKKPLSRPIEDLHWELIERCWSSIGERPRAGDMVLSLQEFIQSYPPSTPLADIFGAPSCSSHPTENCTTTLEHNVHLPGVSEANDIANALVTHQSEQNTGIRKDQEIFLQEHNYTQGHSSDTSVSDDVLRMRNGEPSTIASIVTDQNRSIVSGKEVEDIDEITTKRQRSEDMFNNKDRKHMARDSGHWQIPITLTMPQTRNVIFMGETGSGKSSIINLIAGHNRAAVSNDGMPCTVHFMPYEVSLEGRTYLLWDTPGLTKASESKSRSFRRLRVTQVPEYSLESFLQERCRREELDLFVLCMQGNKVSAETLRIYEIFCRAGRQTTIPLVVAVTRLERIKPTMDAWWQNNEKELAKRGMVFDGHACVTCLSPHQLRSASQQAIHRLISSEYQPRARPPLEKEESPDNSGRGCTIC